GAGRTSDGNGSHASTLKSPSYTKSVSWQHYPDEHKGNQYSRWISVVLGELLIKIWNCDTVQIQTHKKTSSLALERFLADLITINYEAQKK
ncbi:hypothetical protein, partial [Shigella flexneri]|uniref:hypothetical protein n=1 Tax=Shigella flexneri TaxID=623 RepID=UPI001C0A7AF7